MGSCKEETIMKSFKRWALSKCVQMEQKITIVRTSNEPVRYKFGVRFYSSVRVMIRKIWYLCYKCKNTVSRIQNHKRR